MNARLALTFLALALGLSAQNAVPGPALATAAPPEPTAAASTAQPLDTPAVVPGAYEIPKVPMFPSPAYFRNVFGRPDTRVRLAAPTLLRDFVQGDRIELTLRNYLDAVLANNTDLQVQRLSVELPRYQILAEYSIFDPIVNTGFNSTRNSVPTTDQLAGAAVLTSLTQPFNFGVTQLTPTGARYNINFGATKFSTNSAFVNFNPAINSNLNLSFAQPLLRNRGAAITRLQITIARSRLRQTEYQVQDALLRLVALAELAYWEVVAARENLRVQEQALALSAESLKRTKRELELGAISALDIYQPEQQYANFQVQVVQAQYRLQQTEDALRRQISIDLDPTLRTLPIILTEPVEPPTTVAKLDAEALVARALRQRPDLKVVVQSLDIDELAIRQARNAMLPNLSLTGQYGSSGRGGTEYLYENTTDPLLGRVRTLVGQNNLGLFGAFDQMFGFGFPVYGFGLQLQLPLRNRFAQAQFGSATVQKRQDTLRVRNTEQFIRQEVLNAVSLVEQAKASVDLAKIALDFAQKRVDAEQKKYDLGTTVLFFLLSAQTDLVQAQSQVVNQTVQYQRNVVNLQQRTGDLLESRGIRVQ